mmetsp:Transcript_12522/g.18239  ORF Transcript_12522/g.18239 Transcript_12522/m.18239 type:complete len:125 (-) Transcript_12522:313-687(-)
MFIITPALRCIIFEPNPHQSTYSIIVIQKHSFLNYSPNVLEKPPAFADEVKPASVLEYNAESFVEEVKPPSVLERKAELFPKPELVNMGPPETANADAVGCGGADGNALAAPNGVLTCVDPPGT